MDRKITLYVEGGKGVGLGHAARGVALAGALREEGFQPIFLTSLESGLSSFIAPYGFELIECRFSVDSIVAACRQIGANKVIIDSYRFSGNDFAVIADQGFCVICFDDTAARDLPVCAVINGSPAAEKLPYVLGVETRALFGLPYQVVRPGFEVPSSDEYSDTVRRILVTVGGDDLMGIYGELLRGLSDVLSELNSDATIDAVIGPYFQKMDGTNVPDRVHFHVNPGDIRQLMLVADIAISAGGQSLFELARCGVPTVAFCVGEDQVANLEALGDLRIIDYVGWAKSGSWLDRVVSSVIRLHGSKRLRQEVGMRAASLIDGQGAFRIAEAIERMEA